MQTVFAKVGGGVLMPVCNDAKRLIGSLKRDEGVTLVAKKATDMRLHRKMFALLSLGFESWEPNDDLLIIGESRRKDFDFFREHVLILAGHCDVSFGGSRIAFKARSLSPDACDGYDFEWLYVAVREVIWSRVLRYVRYASPLDVERVIELLLSYE